MYLINPYIYIQSFVYTGLYTYQQVSDMIYIQGYIPVASANEFNNLRNAISQTMGSGTDWQGFYTTGYDKKYIQVKHIDLTGSGFSYFNSTFSGTYDGNELNINNLSLVNTDNSKTFAVFYSLTGSIKNMRVNGSVTSNGQYTAGLVSSNASSGTITNCQFNGTVSATNLYTGGLCGTNSGTINTSKFYGSVNGTQTVGGIVGYNGGTVSDCENYGTFNGTTFYFGGIVGYNFTAKTIQRCANFGNSGTDGQYYKGGLCGFNYGIIKDCYSTGNVYGGSNQYNAGFIGSNKAGATITNCYSIGYVSGTTSYGFSANNEGTITNCYWDTQTSGKATSQGGVGKTTTEMIQGLIPDTTIYVDWNPLYWNQGTLTEYPYLTANTGSGSDQGLYTEAQLDTMITTQGYIPVSSASELNGLRDGTNKTMGLGTKWQGTYTTGLDKKYVQVKHIDLSTVSPFAGYSTGTVAFIYDGNELNISNIYLTGATAQQALFRGNRGILKNIYLDGDISLSTAGLSNFAGLCAYNYGNAIIQNCVFSGSCINTGNGGSGGMICGYNEANAYIIDCQGYGTVKGYISIGGVCGINDGYVYDCNFDGNIECYYSYVGGICGRATAATSAIKRCSSTGTITTGSNMIYYLGGFIGEARGIISDCYTKITSVSGKTSSEAVGGFVGRNYATITNCYSTTAPYGTTYVGGFCGYNTGTITNCYWDTVTSGKATSSGGVGKTTTEMKEGLIPDTTIYVDWSTYEWSGGTLTEYPYLKPIYNISDSDANTFNNLSYLSTNTQKYAADYLCTNLKSNNLWSKMTALYPFIGGTALSHKWNLKNLSDTDAAYRLTFAGTITHNDSGCLGGPSGTYANTHLYCSGLTNNNTHMSYYANYNTVSSSFEMGATVDFSKVLQLAINYGGNLVSRQYSVGTAVSQAITGATGFYIGSRTANNVHKAYKNGSQYGSTNTTTETNNITTVPLKIYLFGINYNNVVGYSSDRRSAFASIGTGLSDSEASALYTIIQQVQTILKRQI